MSRTFVRTCAVLLSLTFVAAACTEDSDDGGAAGGDTETTEGGATEGTAGGEEAAALDYDALGLWDDGPCDESLEPLRIGLMTVFESALLSLEDQALALEASAEAFNSRGGAN